jgi:hypothetical protein
MTSERFASLLALAFLAACHSHVDGTRLELVAEPHGTGSVTDGEGNVLELERLELRLDTFELLFCEDPLARLVRELFLPGVAKATHPTTGTPTVLSGPVTIDLAAPEEAGFGELHPPPGRYCGAMFVFGVASVQGTVGEAKLAHELALGATLFVTFDELELSAENLEARLTVRLDVSAAFEEVDLEAADELALADSLRARLADLFTAEHSYIDTHER